MIRVHIRRKVTQENQRALMDGINQLRAAIVGQAGYVSSETLKRVTPPGEILVVSKWQSEFYWTQWYESPERKAIQDQIEDLLSEQTQYEIYAYE